MSTKRILTIKASNDICAAELKHIETIADLFGMAYDSVEFTSIEELKSKLKAKQPYDYIYLAAHANRDGFGDTMESLNSWEALGLVLCETACLKQGAILLLACCRGGLKGVSQRLFSSCAQIDYVCGPRWTVNSHDLTAGFHVFVYNMEIRKEQPSCAAERSSKATGYDFFCYDRVELEDTDSWLRAGSWGSADGTTII